MRQIDATWRGEAKGKATMKALTKSSMALALAAIFSLPCGSILAQAERPAGAKDFEAKWQATIGLSWNENPLRDALNRLSESQEIAIWLDRRIDPDQKITLRVSDQTVEQTLNTLANQLDIGLCVVGPVAYLGPKSTTAKLATVAALREDEMRRLPAERSRVLMSPKSSQWNDLATPQELVDQLATDAKIEVVAQLPHDLWAGNRMPPLSFANRMSLIVAGFDRTFVFSPDGSAVRFVLIPETVEITRKYRLPGSASKAAEAVAKIAPNARLRTVGEELEVTGSQESHDKVRRLLAGERVVRPPVAPTGSRKVFKLTVEEQQIGAILNLVAKETKKKLNAPATVIEKLKARVSFSVDDVGLEELLNATLKGSDLKYRVTETEIQIYQP